MVGFMDHSFLPYISQLFIPPYVVGFMNHSFLPYISKLFRPPYVVGFIEIYFNKKSKKKQLFILFIL